MEVLAGLDFFTVEVLTWSGLGIVVPPNGVVKTQLMEVFVRREGQWWVEAYHTTSTWKPRSNQAGARVTSAARSASR
jgi:hypothetical protein